MPLIHNIRHIQFRPCRVHRNPTWANFQGYGGGHRVRISINDINRAIVRNRAVIKLIRHIQFRPCRVHRNLIHTFSRGVPPVGVMWGMVAVTLFVPSVDDRNRDIHSSRMLSSPPGSPQPQRGTSHGYGGDHLIRPRINDRNRVIASVRHVCFRPRRVHRNPKRASSHGYGGGHRVRSSINDRN